MMWRVVLSAGTFGMLAAVTLALWRGGLVTDGLMYFGVGAAFGVWFAYAWRDTRVPRRLADSIAMACLFLMLIALLYGVHGLVFPSGDTVARPAESAASLVPWLAVFLSLLPLLAGLLVLNMREDGPREEPDTSAI